MKQSEIARLYVLRNKASQTPDEKKEVAQLEAKFASYVATLKSSTSRINIEDADAILVLQGETGLVKDASAFGDGVEKLLATRKTRDTNEDRLLTEDGQWVNGSFVLDELPTVKKDNRIYYKANVITITAGSVYMTKGTDGVERFHIAIKDSLRLPYRLGNTVTKGASVSDFLTNKVLAISKKHKCSIPDAVALLQLQANSELVSALTDF